MRAFIAAFTVCVALSPAYAGEAKIAVAANFTEPAKEIAAAFKAKTGDDLLLSFGSSASFVTQIQQAAPFDAFLSADAERPQTLAKEGLGAQASLFTYAVGKLVLWSREADGVKGEATLRESKFEKIAIANPLAAPYGAAAIETMKSLGLYDALKPKIVEGANIGQAFQFAASGNAPVGFVALSQTIGKGGSSWAIPANLYAPIRQDAILLKQGESNATAKAFLEFLKGPEARAVIDKFGYDVAPAK